MVLKKYVDVLYIKNSTLYNHSMLKQEAFGVDRLTYNTSTKK